MSIRDIPDLPDQDEDDNYQDYLLDDSDDLDDFNSYDSEDGEEEFDIDNPDELGDNENKEESDRYQGVIRQVAGAHLVFKRLQPDGSYSELWIFNVDSKDAEKTKRINNAIVSGTDIDPDELTSADGSQEAEYTTLGNIQMVEITGLPN